MQEGEAGVLHRGVHQQPLGEGIHHRRGHHALLDVAFVLQEFEVGEQYFGHAGDADEGDEVGFGQRAADGAEFPAERQVFEIQPQSQHFVAIDFRHAVFPSRFAGAGAAGRRPLDHQQTITAAEGPPEFHNRDIGRLLEC